MRISDWSSDVCSSDLVALFAPARRIRTDFEKARATVTLADGRVLSAPLVIAADGRYSPSRAEAAIKVNTWSYPQTGIVARSEERRVGKECVSLFSSRWSRTH